MWNPNGASAGQGGFSYSPVCKPPCPHIREKGHAHFKSVPRTRRQVQTAETIPAGAQREMFFDMAKRWTDLAINIEGSEALADPASPPANDPGEPYRFGSGIMKAQIS